MSSQYYVNRWFRNNIIYRGISVAANLLHHITSSTPLEYVLCHACTMLLQKIKGFYHGITKIFLLYHA